MSMKKLVYIFTSLLLLSCVGTGGFDEQEGADPLSECVISAVAEAGGEAIIQWNGFSEDAAVALISSEGKSYDMTVDVVTASGLVFLIPADLPAGVYKVKVTMSGKELELGEIEITVSEKKPEDGQQPDEDSSEDDKGTEENEQNPDQEENPETDPQPGDDPEVNPGENPEENPGEGDGEDPSDEQDPEIPVASKVLSRIEYYSPYSEGSQLLRAWEINRTSSPALKVSEYVVDASEATLSGYDEYSGDGSGYFEQVTDGLGESSHVKMTYLMNSDNRVNASDVVSYGKKDPVRYTWEYDSQQRLSEISYVHASAGDVCLASLSYEGNNLAEFSGILCEYADPSLVNAAGAADVVWGYMAVSNGREKPAYYFPYLMGWYDVKSASLPTAMSLPSSSGSGTEACALGYVFDEDGYVTEMNWTSGKNSFKVAFVYAIE